MLGLWPAELKPQAQYAYKLGRARRMIAKARELGWTALPAPHIAFHNAGPPQRLYMAPALDAVEYARRWEGSGLRLRRELEPAAARALGGPPEVAVALRLEVDAILRAGDELPLPASRSINR